MAGKAIIIGVVAGVALIALALEGSGNAQPNPPAPPPNPKPNPYTGPGGPVGPEPGLGAWKSNSAYITKYQTALTTLAEVNGKPQWDPGSISGSADGATIAAVKSFQRDNGLGADGEVGNSTASAIDSMWGNGTGATRQKRK